MALGVLTFLFVDIGLAGPGRCDYKELESVYFPRGPDGGVDRVASVKVIQQQTPVYPSATATEAVDTLAFNESVRVLALEGARVQVGHAGTLEALGWVERSALLCGIAPLKSDRTGIEQKMYLRPSEYGTIRAYSTFDLQQCDEQCQELPPFEGYFVFDVDEAQHSYLLGDTYNLGDTSQLIGWVSDVQGLLWDTVYGVRPADTLVFPENHPLAGKPEIVCAYMTPADALQQPVQRCLPVPGGDRWYLSAHRLPMLEQEQYEERGFYKVLLPLKSVTLPFQKGNNREQEALLEAYLPVSDELVEDVWVKRDDLDRWLSLLREFDAVELQELSGFELRQTFVFALADALEKILRKPLFENTEEPLHDYLQRHGLPVRGDSPLFRYSIADLMDQAVVPDCELVRLIAWLDQTHQLLNIVYYGDRRPVYTAEEFPGECPSGKHIPYIPGEITHAPLGKDAEMSYQQHFGRVNMYWVPKEYLP